MISTRKMINNLFYRITSNAVGIKILDCLFQSVQTFFYHESETKRFSVEQLVLQVGSSGKYQEISAPIRNVTSNAFFTERATACFAFNMTKRAKFYLLI